MKLNKQFAVVLFSALGLAMLASSQSFADTAADSQPAGMPQMQLPPGWTAQDMQAMMAAGTPGKMQEHLAQDVGTWRGTTTMWMFPGDEPMTTKCTSTVSPVMDGRYTKMEMTGEMPGMGAYHGMGISGFDNVSQKFVSTWIDNHGTGMANGEGELSADGKTLTWQITGNCPITKKPMMMREIDTTTGPNSKKLEMFGTDPKSGREFKMMEIKLTKE